MNWQRRFPRWGLWAASSFVAASCGSGGGTTSTTSTSASPEWTGDLATYRQMLVNLEVGHLLGQHHPDVDCPAPGEPAPTMSQQSTELEGCLPNPWPLDWEVACAAQHVEPLAPGYEPDPAPTCGPGP